MFIDMRYILSNDFEANIKHKQRRAKKFVFLCSLGVTIVSVFVQHYNETQTQIEILLEQYKICVTVNKV